MAGFNSSITRRGVGCLIGALVAAVAATMFGVPVGADAATLEPAPTVSPSTAAPGDVVNVGVPADSCADLGHMTVLDRVVLVDDWTPVVATPADSGGWTAAVTVPSDAAAGTRSVSYFCDTYEFGPFASETSSLIVTTATTGDDDPATDDDPSTGEDPETGATVTLSKSTVGVGGSLDVTGTGFDPDEEVTITLHSDPVLLATVRASATGTLAATVTIPAGTPAGDHHIELVGSTSGHVVRAPLTVSGVGALVDGDLPRTGSTTSGMMVFGGGVAVLGMLAVIVANRIRLSAARKHQ